MALLLQPPNSGNKAPNQSLEDALKDFENSLPDKHRQDFLRRKNVPNSDAVLIFTAELDARNKERRGRSIASNFFSVLKSVQDFSTIVGTFVSAHPDIAALVWGSVSWTMIV